MNDDHKTQRTAALRAARRSKEEKDAVVNVLLNDGKGREYLWWLLTITKVNANPWTPNALTTSFACGEMNIGQQILAHIMEVNPAGYVQMLKEKLNGPVNGTNIDSADDNDD